MLAIPRARRAAATAVTCLLAASAAASGAIAGTGAVAGAPPHPSPPSHTASPVRLSFSGWIASATGRFAHDKGHLTIIITHPAGSGTLPMTLRVRPRSCPATGRCVRLSGTATGTITALRMAPDAGRDQRLRATGRVKPLGAVGIRGDWQIPGFIRGAHERLQLTLATPHGHLVINAT